MLGCADLVGVGVGARRPGRRRRCRSSVAVVAPVLSPDLARRARWGRWPGRARRVASGCANAVRSAAASRTCRRRCPSRPAPSADDVGGAWRLVQLVSPGVPHPLPEIGGLGLERRRRGRRPAGVPGASGASTSPRATWSRSRSGCVAGVGWRRPAGGASQFVGQLRRCVLVRSAWLVQAAHRSARTSSRGRTGGWVP